MKAFLLAAGLGSRLRPLTDSTPKCLLPIRGVPLLAIWLELCAQAGITSVLINVHAHADTVKKFLCSRRFPVSVEIAEEANLLGSAGTVAENRAWVEGERDFFILYGDVLTNVDLRGIRRHHDRCRQLATLGLYRVPNPSCCGVVKVDNASVITEFEEKPAHPASNLVFAGVMVARAEFVNIIPKRIPADIGYHVLPSLTGRMAGYEIKNYLKDIGTLEAYEQVQQNWPGLEQEQRC